jgi:endonuclease/exonuclease/phosphatase family metal-dependent hydrolase
MLSLFLSVFLTFVELNCENLFDCRHDSLKQDTEFTPEGGRHWTRTKYWTKLNHIGQEILSCSDDLPDIVALCEVENDTVIHDLTRRSLLRNAGYEYLMTESPDVRGIDVALLYQPMRFLPLCYDYIEVEPLKDMRPTRDILYVKGVTQRLDTLHLFVVHAPSRYGGEKASRPYRMQVAKTLIKAMEPLRGSNIIVTGDFNDYADSEAMKYLEGCGLTNISHDAKGCHGTAKGTYRYNGGWHSLDHFLISAPLLPRVKDVYINDAPFLLEEEPVYGGKRPRRSFTGFRYNKNGFSDHLPLVIRLL